MERRVQIRKMEEERGVKPRKSRSRSLSEEEHKITDDFTQLEIENCSSM